jgi:hypothetical protein
MDVAFTQGENRTVYIHNLTEEQMQEWEVKTDQLRQLSATCSFLRFKIGTLLIILFAK